MRQTRPRKWLRPVLKPLRPAFREVLAMSLFVNLLALAAPVFVLQVYDRVVFFAGLTTLQGLVIGMAIALLFDFVLRQARSRMLQRVALRIDVEVGRRLFDKLLALPLRALESKPSAYWQALFRDIEVVRNVFSGASAILLTDLPFAVLFVSFIFVIALPIAWLLIIVLPLFLLLAWRSAAVLGAASAEERSAGFARDALVAEMIAGRATAKALALGDSLRPAWEDRHAETIERALNRGGRADSYVNLGTMLTVFTTVLLTSVGALAIIDQRLSIGALIATNMLAGRIISPFQQLVSMWRNYATARQAIARLGDVFAADEDRRDSEIKLDRPQGDLRLENVSFRYAEDAAPVIEGVKLHIKPGGMHAVVGPNGSGKTTLLKLINGLYPPTTGRALLDGADIAQFTRKELARWIGYAPQEAFLFAGSIRDNIAKGRPEATDQEIIAAAAGAGLHQHVIELPDGYATEIGEAGMRLSGGLRQRIVIARALIGRPPILLLDETSANLDRQAEEALAKTLSTLARDHTIIVVSHSPVLLSACNNVLALDKGKVAMAGPADEVLLRLFPGRVLKPVREGGQA